MFVVDAQEGLVPGDEEIAERLHGARPAGDPGGQQDRRQAGAARARSSSIKLGFEPVVEVSAEHGDGVAELLDEVVARCRRTTDGGGGRSTETAVAIVGRPNVGKSSLVNRLLREERVMVNEMPGTTRDTVDVVLHWHKRQFRIVDTAGMRRPGRVARGRARSRAVSVVLAKRAMARADVVVLVVDATEGAGDREGAIAGEAEEAGCGIVIAVNKWDLVRGQGQDFVEEFDDKLRFQLKFLEYAPIVHVSALTGERTAKLLEVVDRVAAARQKRVPTSELNKFLETVTAAHPPTSKNRREVRILYGAQTARRAAGVRAVHERGDRAALSPTSGSSSTSFARRSGSKGTPIRLKVRKRAR